MSHHQSLISYGRTPRSSSLHEVYEVLGTRLSLISWTGNKYMHTFDVCEAELATFYTYGSYLRHFHCHSYPLHYTRHKLEYTECQHHRSQNHQLDKLQLAQRRKLTTFSQYIKSGNKLLQTTDHKVVSLRWWLVTLYTYGSCLHLSYCHSHLLHYTRHYLEYTDGHYHHSQNDQLDKLRLAQQRKLI